MYFKKTFYLGISLFFSSSVAYFYMVSSWGGYVFLINLIPMHVFTLMICGRYNHRVYVAYSTVYVIGTILSMQISFVGFQPVQTSEHMLVRKIRLFFDSQYVEADLNKNSCSGLKTTRAWKGISYRFKITQNWNPRKSNIS